jgi:hypothetical protein
LEELVNKSLQALRVVCGDRVEFGSHNLHYQGTLVCRLKRVLESAELVEDAA